MTTQSSPDRWADTLDPKRVASHIDESRAYAKQIDEHWHDLVKRHADQWVAAYKGEFLFGSTVGEVITLAKSRGWPLDVVAVEHLSAKRPSVLL